MPVGSQEADAYNGILSYLGTLDNPADLCTNILTFYSTLNYGRNDTTGESVLSQINPYEVPPESVSTCQFHY